VFRFTVFFQSKLCGTRQNDYYAPLSDQVKVAQLVKARIKAGKVGAFTVNTFQPMTDITDLSTTAILLVQV
jgi:hypothetical protein